MRKAYILLLLSFVILLLNCKKKAEEYGPIFPDLEVIVVTDDNNSTFPLGFISLSKNNFTVLSSAEVEKGHRSIELTDVVFDGNNTGVLRREVVASNLYVSFSDVKFVLNKDKESFTGLVTAGKTVILNGKNPKDFNVFIKNPANSIYVTSFEEDDNGYIIIAEDGRRYSSKMVIEKIDKNFNTIWSKTYHNSLDSGYINLPTNILKFSDGTFAIISNMRSYANSPSKEIDYRFLRINSNGDSLLLKDFFEVGYQKVVNKVVAKNDKLYLLVNLYDRPPSTSKNSIICMDKLGNILWEKIYDEQLNIDNIKVSKKGIALVGNRESNHPKDFYVSEIDEQGNMLWEKSYGASGLRHLGYDIHIGDGFYYALVAQLSNTSTRSRTLVIKGQLND